MSTAMSPAVPVAADLPRVHDPYGYDSDEPTARSASGVPRVSNSIPPPNFDTPPPAKAPSIAEQMMKKMGWSEGQGKRASLYVAMISACWLIIRIHLRLHRWRGALQVWAGRAKASWLHLHIRS